MTFSRHVTLFFPGDIKAVMLVFFLFRNYLDPWFEEGSQIWPLDEEMHFFIVVPKLKEVLPTKIAGNPLLFHIHYDECPLF